MKINTDTIKIIGIIAVGGAVGYSVYRMGKGMEFMSKKLSRLGEKFESGIGGVGRGLESGLTGFAEAFKESMRIDREKRKEEIENWVNKITEFNESIRQQNRELFENITSEFSELTSKLVSKLDINPSTFQNPLITAIEGLKEQIKELKYDKSSHIPKSEQKKMRKMVKKRHMSDMEKITGVFGGTPFKKYSKSEAKLIGSAIAAERVKESGIRDKSARKKLYDYYKLEYASAAEGGYLYEYM